MEGKGKGSPLQLLLTLYNNRKNKISYVFSYSLAQLVLCSCLHDARV